MDLKLIPLARHNGQDDQILPGVRVAAQPRRPARGRKPDRLILYLDFEGNRTLPPEQQEQLLKSVAQTYYQTGGSVTAALRASADDLNKQLLDYNLHSTSSEGQIVGLLNLLTIRNDRLYLAQCGLSHGYLISDSGVRYFHDSQPAGRGLGLGRTTPIYYSQAQIGSGDILILTPQPPADWSPTNLGRLYGKEVEPLSQNLLSMAGSNLHAVLIRAEDGPGKTYLLRPKLAAGAAVATTISKSTETEESGTPPEQQVVPMPIPAERIPPNESLQPTEAYIPPTQPSGEAEISSAEPVSRQKESVVGPVRAGLAAMIQSAGSAMGKFTLGLRTFISRLLPGEGLFTLPSSVMVFIAIAVPLVVVTIATVVYFQRGRAGQHEVYLAQAVQAAGFARSQTDPQTQLVAWQEVIRYLDEADGYQFTPNSQQLRFEAQQVIDDLNMITRLVFQPALTGNLPETTQISRMAVTESDLYLLDSSDGQVWRAFSSGVGYELDETFQCGPGFPGSQNIGPLLDILALPKSEESGATLLGMDSNGNLLHCHPGEPPLFNVLEAPSTGWVQPQAFTINLGNLYVLDPQANAVWIYWNSDFTQQPQLFFDEQVPPMESVIDLALDKSDLYLLHDDGHITVCAFSELGVAPTRCTDPAPYTDSRPGLEGQLLSPHPAFTEITSTLPPDPSLVLLDPDSRAIYHFSLRLTYIRQYRPQIDLDSIVAVAAMPASSFGISLDSRVIFMALGNQVIYAGMP
jgi:hypothetical protein